MDGGRAGWPNRLLEDGYPPQPGIGERQEVQAWADEPFSWWLSR